MIELVAQKIAVAILSPLIALMGFAGYDIGPRLGASNDIETSVALFETSLASSITAAATSMTLVSATTFDGTSLASSTYSFIIDEGTASQEFVKADCTGTACTNMQRGISAITGTSTVSGLAKAHRRGATVKITDAPTLPNITRILNGIGGFPNVLRYTSSVSVSTSSNDIPTASWVGGIANVASTSAKNTVLGGTNTWAGNQTFQGSNTHSGTNAFTGSVSFTSLPTSAATPSTGTEFATKTYVDAQVVAGGVPASTSTPGISQMAYRQDIASSTGMRGGYSLTISPDQATSTFGIATTSIVATLPTGLLSNTLLPVSTAGAFTIGGNLSISGTCTGCKPGNVYGGDGSDGALSITSGTTNIDLGGSPFVVKNYTSISITGSGALTFSNASSTGTAIFLLSQNACTFTSSAVPMVDARGTGAASVSAPGNNPGLTGISGIGYTLYKTIGGGAGTGGGAGGGGKSIASATLSLTTNTLQNSYLAQRYHFGFFGGSGGTGSATGGAGQANGANGGSGGGMLIIECGGALNYTTANGISAAGSNGGNPIGGSGSEGGGGGGAGGYVGIFATGLTATSTINVSGGTGGTGDGGTGGTGENGTSTIGYIP